MPLKPTSSLTYSGGQDIVPVTGIIAGGGSLPLEIADELLANGRRPFLIAIENEAGEGVSRYDHTFIAWGQAGQIFPLFEAQGVRDVVFAGSIKTRPDIQSLKLDWTTLKTLPEILSMMLGGDNTILSSCIKMFEKRGFRLLGAHEVAPGLLATEGRIAGKKPSKADFDNIKCAFEAIKLLSTLDIGQAAIAEAGRVVAIEGVEGTDNLISRIVDMREIGRMPEKGKNGVLVKAMKTGQDMRADLPSIGPKTVQNVHAAGLHGIVVEAGAALILAKQETLEVAKRLGIYVYGMKPEQDDV